MNIFTVDRCGLITEDDHVLVIMQNLSKEHALQVMTQLVMATGHDCHARFVGMDPQTGEMLDPKYAQWVLRADDLKAEHAAKIAAAAEKNKDSAP